MSKYQLEDLLNEITGTGRIGTYIATYRELINKVDELKEKGIKVKELGMSGDGKTPFEFEIYPGDKDEAFSVYPYKFDPRDEDDMEIFRFSIGGKPVAIRAAKELLGQGAMSNAEVKDGLEYLKDAGDDISDFSDLQEEEVNEVTMANVNVDEVKFHLDAYESGTIDGDDLHKAISEIFFGEVKAPGMREEEVTEEVEEIDEAMMPRPSLFKGTETEIQSYLDSLKREYDKDKEKFKKDYLDFSDADWKEDFGNYAADKALQEHFGRFMKDYQ